MKKNKVITFKNHPTPLPVFPTMTLFLFLDRFNTPQWVWGLVGGIWIIMCLTNIYQTITEKRVDIFKESP